MERRGQLHDGGGNNELQCYVDSADNIFLRDGMLHITARKESDGSVTSVLRLAGANAYCRNPSL